MMPEGCTCLECRPELQDGVSNEEFESFREKAADCNYSDSEIECLYYARLEKPRNFENDGPILAIIKQFRPKVYEDIAMGVLL